MLLLNHIRSNNLSAGQKVIVLFCIIIDISVNQQKYRNIVFVRLFCYKSLCQYPFFILVQHNVYFCKTTTNILYSDTVNCQALAELFWDNRINNSECK